MGTFNSAALLTLGLLTAVSSRGVNTPEKRSFGEKVLAAVATAVAEAGSPQVQAAPQDPSGDPGAPSAAKRRQGDIAFEYPFPGREEIFLPPEKKPRDVETQLRSDEGVELMGFADVGGARVILKIDGIVTPLRVGESRGDVRVLAIDPPKVVLQRAQRRWTESLVDTPQ